MIEWFTWIQFGVGLVAGLFCLGAAFANRKPSDYTAGSLLLVEILTLVQLVVAIIAPFLGNPNQGDGVEFWMYMITAAIIPPAAILWALIERNRWSNAVLGVAALSIAVMVVRMQQIWLDSAAVISG